VSENPAPTLKRRDLYPDALIDGVPARNWAGARLARQFQRALVTRGERAEGELERRIRSLPGVSRPNVVALVSPKGGVGKTTSTFLLGNLLSTHLNLRVVAVDANPDFGTLGRLAPDERRSERSLVDLIERADGLRTAAELNQFVSRLPTGLHVLAAPAEAEFTERLGPDRYGELVAFLSCFYEVVLLDLGTGVAGPLARFALERADQVVLVTTPDWVTATVVLDALAHVRHDRTTLVLNKTRFGAAELPLVEARFRRERVHRSVLIPHDEQLATMLDSGCYALDALTRATRVAIKQLGLSAAEQLV
jgi:MinD-like ATPase involved in chromosome partitioning or flagellar assembly